VPQRIDIDSFRPLRRWSQRRQQNTHSLFRALILLAAEVNAASSPSVRPNLTPAAAGNHKFDDVVRLYAPGTVFDDVPCRVERSPLYEYDGTRHPGAAHLILLSEIWLPDPGVTARKQFAWPWTHIAVTGEGTMTRRGASSASEVQPSRGQPPITVPDARERARSRLRDYFAARWGAPIRLRDDFTCQRCGRGWYTDGAAIAVHHKTRFVDLIAEVAAAQGLNPDDLHDWPELEAACRRDPRLNDPENGVTLCKACHNLFPDGGIDFEHRPRRSGP
jgi:hypothetical protein